MNKFSWYEAKTVEDALGQVTATVSDLLQPKAPMEAAVFKSGGIDLLDLMKEGLAQPGMIVNIKNIRGLDQIDMDPEKGLRLGANVTLAQIEADEMIRNKYPALYQAVTHAGTPQLRNVASLGGNLAQRTRCWYFRSANHQCFRKGSGTCYARTGENAFHAIMDNEDCASVHSSSVATALMAFGSRIEIAGPEGRREVPMNTFFVLPSNDSTRENILKADELITAVIVPPMPAGAKSYYLKQGSRESYDWALADVAVVLEMSGAVCRSATVILGAAAPVPLRSGAAAAVLAGKRINEKTAGQAAEAAVKGATPLSGNGYKVPLFKAIIKRAILKAAEV